MKENIYVPSFCHHLVIININILLSKNYLIDKDL